MFGMYVWMLIIIYQFEKNVKDTNQQQPFGYLNIKLCHSSKIVRMCQNKKVRNANIMFCENVSIIYIVEGLATIQVIFVS